MWVAIRVKLSTKQSSVYQRQQCLQYISF
uniref:Uncharacterized protein n=1 Tax=Anguilla anguilla TaxID=7936 RepID=A0A0E9UZM8_ANGAN